MNCGNFLGRSVNGVDLASRCSAGRLSRNRASFVGPSLMWAPFMPAKPALECGSSSYRLPPLIHTAIAPELERERR
jgi:hypothetical protein